MKIFGRDFFKKKDFSSYGTGVSCNTGLGGWFPYIRESFSGAWQQNITLSHDSILAFSAVYSCITLIASDIAKLPIKIMSRDADGIWTETDTPDFPVLRKPNSYQNRMRFIEQWLIAKLSRGNAYIYKERDRNKKVIALYPLDPCRVRVLVSPDGSVLYQLSEDNLSDIEEAITVPASEIIHDMTPALFHPLCGTPPIFACGLSALQGLNIQKNSANFFGNMSRPSGVLTAPGAISDETALRLKENWETNFAADKMGKTAVLGDGLKYEAMTLTAESSQLIEQLKWTAQDVCSCFHVPAYKVGFADVPTYNNAEILNQIYYSDCLQSLIESIEMLLDEGLELPQTGKAKLGTEFDLDALLRMDRQTRYKSNSEAIGGGWISPNEIRRKEDMKPVEGGDTPYLQQQNFSLAALADRDKALSEQREAAAANPTAPADTENNLDTTQQMQADWDIKFMDTLKMGFAT